MSANSTQSIEAEDCRHWPVIERVLACSTAGIDTAVAVVAEHCRQWAYNKSLYDDISHRHV